MILAVIDTGTAIFPSGARKESLEKAVQDRLINQTWIANHQDLSLLPTSNLLMPHPRKVSMGASQATSPTKTNAAELDAQIKENEPESRNYAIMDIKKPALSRCQVITRSVHIIETVQKEIFHVHEITDNFLPFWITDISPLSGDTLYIVFLFLKLNISPINEKSLSDSSFPCLP